MLNDYGKMAGENMILMNLPNFIMKIVLFESQLYLEIFR